MRKKALIILACLSMTALVGAFLRANAYIADAKAYIEVGGKDPVFVPRDVQFVKFDGKIRRVLRFAEAVEGSAVDCRCPKCCDGECYVIVYTQDLRNKILSVPSIIWLPCH